MKEFHAYLNEDGTYRVGGTDITIDNSVPKNVTFDVPRAKIVTEPSGTVTIKPLADINGVLMTLVVEENK